MKKGMLVYSAPQVASMRIFFAGLVFLPVIILKFNQIPWNKYVLILLFGLLEVGIPPYLYTFAQTKVDSSTAGILNSLVPLFTLFLGFTIFKFKYNWKAYIGVLIGLVGAFIMTFMKNSGNGNTIIDFTNVYGIFIVFATLLYGLAGNILMIKLNEVNGLMITGLSFVSLAIPAGIYLFSTDFIKITITSANATNSLFSVLILSVFGSALAILLFSKLIKLSNALIASFVTYLIPFVSMFWGWLDGEKISLLHFSSLIIILAGIYIANIDEFKKIKQN